MHFQHGQQNW